MFNINIIMSVLWVQYGLTLMFNINIMCSVCVQHIQYTYVTLWLSIVPSVCILKRPAREMTGKCMTGHHQYYREVGGSEQDVTLGLSSRRWRSSHQVITPHNNIDNNNNKLTNSQRSPLTLTSTSRNKGSLPWWSAGVVLDCVGDVTGWV